MMVDMVEELYQLIRLNNFKSSFYMVLNPFVDSSGTNIYKYSKSCFRSAVVLKA